MSLWIFCGNQNFQAIVNGGFWLFSFISDIESVIVPSSYDFGLVDMLLCAQLQFSILFITFS